MIGVSEVVIASNNSQDDEFHRIAEGDVHEGPKSWTKSMGNGFCGKGKDTCQRNDGDGIKSEDNIRIDIGKVDCDAGRDKNEQDIHPTMEECDLRVV